MSFVGKFQHELAHVFTLEQHKQRFGKFADADNDVFARLEAARRDPAKWRAP